MDAFREQIVEKQANTNDTLKKVGIAAGAAVLAVIVCFVATFFLQSLAIGVLGAGFIFYGGYYLMVGISCEFEYIFVNGTLDVDKIIGKRTRKRLCSIDMKDILSFGEYSDEMKLKEGYSKIIATDGKGEGIYYIEFKNSSLGNGYLFFNPDDRMLEVMDPFIPRRVRN